MGRFVHKVATVMAVMDSIAAMIPGPWQPFAAAGAALWSGVAALTKTKPGVKGSPTDITIGGDQGSDYLMGRSAAKLAQVHDVGYGGTVSDVPNPYRSMVYVLSVGLIGSIEALQADFTTVAFSSGQAVGYYHGFLWADTQLGACPEASALTGPFGAIPAFGADAKISGKAAVMFTAKWDKKGKVYASGLPQWGVIVGEGVQVYDQRQDDTYPGGSGDCRALDEATYVGGDAAHNPSCHGVTYALGRYQGDTPKKVMGCGIPASRIDWPAWTDFANLCDANNWKIGGSVTEPGSRWDNLKRICAAGGAMPVWTGGLLSVIFPRPRVALDTISAADLADGEVRIPAMRGWKDRINGIIPKFPSEANRWELVASDLVTSSTYVDEDRGEEKNQEVPYELVPYKDQAAQLAAYDLTNGREISGIVIPCKPRLMRYRIGDALEIGADLDDETDMGGKVLVITGRHRDPATAIVTFTFDTETDAKHDFALGRTGTAPPSPTLPTGEEMDDAAAVIAERDVASLIKTSEVIDSDPADGLLQADDSNVTIEDHSRRYADKTKTVDGDTLALVAAEGELNHIYYDDLAREGGEVTYVVTDDPVEASNSPDNPGRHYVGSILTPPTGETNSGGGQTPPGWDGHTFYNLPPDLIVDGQIE